MTLAAAAVLPAYAQPGCPVLNFQQIAQLLVQDPADHSSSGLIRQPDRSFTQVKYTRDPTSGVVTKIATVPNFQLNVFNCIGVAPRAPKPGPPPNRSIDPLGTQDMGTIVTDLAGDGVGAIVGLQDKFAPNRVIVANANPDLTVKNAASYLVGLAPRGVLAGDFNGDGKRDVAVVYFGPPSFSGVGGISLLLGNGDGTLKPAVNYPTGGGTDAATAFDFNGDGRTDLAVTNYLDRNVTILLGNTDGTLRAGGTFGTGDQPTAIAAADVNGDGKVDLIVGTLTGMSVLLGNGDGTFRTGPKTTVGFSLTFQFIATGDFNKDGKLDVAMLSPFGNVVLILNGAGDGTFSIGHAYLTARGHDASQSQDNFFVEDFDGDGNLDLVFASGHPDVLTPNESRTMGVLLGNGDGTFIGAPAYPVESNPTNVVTADFNGDGKPDLATVSLLSGRVSVLLGQGGSLFQTGAPIPTNTSAHSIAAGDLNGDGKADIVTTDGMNSVVVLIGNGDGTFRPPMTIPVNGAGTEFVIMGDFNNDHKTDLAVADSTSNTVSILLGNGDGTFRAPISVPAGTNPVNLVTGDFNRDGFLDLAVANSTGFLAASPGSISILLGKGDGTFQPAVPYSGVFSPVAITTGDFNGDGKTDLIVAATTPDFNFALVELLGNGDGSFQPPILIPTIEFGPAKIAVADFNGDGKQDLIVPHCCGENDITYLLGNGDGTFQSETFLTGGSLNSSVVADFNGDGRPDVAFSSLDSGNNLDTISVFLNLTGPSSGGTPFSIAPFGGSGQSTAVNTAFPVPLQTIVKDSNGNPLSGITVTFTAPASGPSATFPGGNTAVTSALGIASITALANGMAGNYNVTAAVGALSTIFALTNVASSGAPSLTITKTHTGSFAVGGTGTYTITAGNAASAGPTTGIVSVTETVPAGLTLVSMAGTGWTCPGPPANTCTRGDSLAAGQTYPPITVTVNVAANATSPQVNMASVSGVSSATATAMDSTVITGANLAPVLSIAKTHTGNFAAGQLGATYTLAVSNAAGAAATTGTVTVTETLPAGLTLVSMAGMGWTCPGTAANNCTRIDALAAGQSYPPITVTVNVAANAASPQVNMASVSGGGSAPAAAMDSTVVTGISPGPVLSITKTHTGNFTQGQPAATYTLTVSNAAGAGPTTGPVTVTDTLPAGLTLVSMAGTGWTCPGTAANNCTRNDALAAAQSYPPITVTVSVAANAPTSLTNMASVSGGGAASAAAMDLTAVATAGAATIILSPLSLSPGSTGLLTISVSPAAGSGGAFIVLMSSDPSVVSLSTATPSPTANVLIPPGGTSTTLRVVGGKAGVATITASGFGYSPATIGVQVGGGAGGTSTITAAGGTPQSTPTNTLFASPLVAAVTSGGSPAVGVPVTFTAPAVGPSALFAGATSVTVMTNSMGLAMSPFFMANSIPGSYSVLASTPSAASPAVFSLTNTGGAVILLAPLTVRAGTTFVLPVSLSSPAGDAVIVSLTSSNPMVLSLSSATITGMANALILAGTTSGGVRVVALSPGTVTVTAQATGFAPVSTQVTVVP